MVHLTRILCPVDFSEFSRHALSYALQLARWYDARVTVLHVAQIAVPVGIGAPALVDPSVMHDGPALRAIVRDFVDAEHAGGVSFDVDIAEGQVWREIADRGRDLAADLLVLGTHGRAGFERLLLGSVTEKLLHEAACPVLTVPRTVRHPPPAAGRLFTRILCPTDFSAACDNAMAWAVSLAQESSAELCVLHVFEEHIPQDAARFSLAAGMPHRTILDAAAERHCDLIVMGAAPHHGVMDRLFGTIPQHVVRAAPCPVLTVR